MNKIDWEILANHLTGQANEEEQKKLAEWLGESAKNRDLLERLKKLWLVEQSSAPRIDTEKALRLVLSRIQQSSPARMPVTSRKPISFINRPVSEFLTRPLFLRAAAVLAVAIGAFTVFTLVRSNRDSETSSVTFGSVQTLQLTDGTRITFDVGSTFRYPNSFQGADARTVFLDGEAYFEVAHDDRLPFTIHANGGAITVLGTSFAVRAWKSDEHVVVAVKEGRVSFQPEINNDTSKIVYLTENTMSRLSQTEKTPTPAKEIDFSAYVSWMKKEIYFQNTPVPEVFRQLERWYGVKIQSADSTMLQENITVFIGNKPLSENLNLLSLIFNMNVEQSGDTVRFVSR